MSQGTIEQVLGRMLTDDRFRRRAMLSLEETLQKEGYNLSSRELKSIKQVDMLRLEIVAHDMDMVLKRFNGWLPHC
ncbi:MAG: Franean1_4349 family RiPP [Geobacteraceae bacterium]|nr:Franean1_4349 family RiPP [Geobacteraceae bacterium]